MIQRTLLPCLMSVNPLTVSEASCVFAYAPPAAAVGRGCCSLRDIPVCLACAPFSCHRSWFLLGWTKSWLPPAKIF